MQGQKDELKTWSESMAAKGYVKGPSFETYEQLSEWDRQNTRPHLRRRTPGGYMIFFTEELDGDRTPSVDPVEEDPTDWRILDDEIPF